MTVDLLTKSLTMQKKKKTQAGRLMEVTSPRCKCLFWIPDAVYVNARATFSWCCSANHGLVPDKLRTFLHLSISCLLPVFKILYNLLTIKYQLQEHGVCLSHSAPPSLVSATSQHYIHFSFMFSRHNNSSLNTKHWACRRRLTLNFWCEMLTERH